MNKHTDTGDDIEAIDAITAIRRRPAMFIGELSTPDVVNTLLAESLCLALDNAISGCATELHIHINPDGSASVWDNGPGCDVTRLHDGMTEIERLLTCMYACRDAKRNQVIRQSTCGAGMICTNALSEWLVVELVHAGWLWTQRFVRGYATGPIEKEAQVADVWQRITFRPDREVFGNATFDTTQFIGWYKSQSFKTPQTLVTLHDEKNSQVHVLASGDTNTGAI